MEGREWKEWTVPYLVSEYEDANDLSLYGGYDYFNDDIIGPPKDGDVAVTPVRTTDNAKEEEEVDVHRGPISLSICASSNQLMHDNGIVYERHSKGIPMLQICDLKLQYGSEDHVKYSWKLDEVSKEECKLEIDRSNKNEHGKKIVKFGFATNDTDKLLSRVVDGYEVKYMLRTDAIRLRLELEINIPDYNSVHGEIWLEFERRHGNSHTIHLLHDQRPIKKPKLNHNSDTFKLSIIRNVPRNLRPCMFLVVRLEDSSGTLVDGRHAIFSYNIPVDQEDYFYFKNGYIKFNVRWGCCFRDGKGLCNGVCTCGPAEFVGFDSHGEVSCIKNNEK